MPHNLKYDNKQQKKRINEHMYGDNISSTASDFNTNKINIAILYLKYWKACGSDGIHNEFLIIANNEMRHKILYFISFI